MDLFVNFIESQYPTIIATILIILIGSIISILKGFITKKLSSLSLDAYRFFSKKQHYPSNDVLKMVDTVNSDLATTRILMKSDRASIFEFHNGDYFISKNSKYKLSCLYEKTSAGVSEEAKNFQNIDVSLIWDGFLEPLIFNKTKQKTPGFFEIENEITKCLYCQKKKDLFLIDIEKLDADTNGYVKTMFENHGSKYMIIIPIRNSENIVYGFIAFDYIHEEVDFEFLNELPFCEVCKTSRSISYLWQKNETNKLKAIFLNIKKYSSEDK